MFDLAVEEYVNKKNNWLLTEITVTLNEVIVDRRLQVIDMNTGTRPPYIDDVWEYEWEIIK